LSGQQASGPKLIPPHWPYKEAVVVHLAFSVKDVTAAEVGVDATTAEVIDVPETHW
jgi:hypothetical protein